MTGRKYALIFLLFFSLATGTSSAQYFSFRFDGYARSYLVHLPSGYTGERPLPLVVAMHGGFGSAYNLERQSGLSRTADKEHFIVVYPEGVKGGAWNIRSWNAGWCCGYASWAGIDDVGFITALLDTLSRRYAVDPHRIYATGMSNGGFMCYRLACELSGRIAAIAPVAASMSLKDCHPQHAVSIIHFHSYRDTHVPWQGGYGSGLSGHYNLPLDSVMGFWAAADHCRGPDTLQNDSELTHLRWVDPSAGTEIQLYLTRDGGHSWPGGHRTPVGDPPAQTIRANELMWRFFMEHPLR